MTAQFAFLDILPEGSSARTEKNGYNNEILTQKEIATVLEHITSLLMINDDGQQLNLNPFPFEWPQTPLERLAQNERLSQLKLSLNDKLSMFVADPLDKYIMKLTLALILRRREEKSFGQPTFLTDSEEAALRRLGLFVFGAALAKFWQNARKKEAKKIVTAINPKIEDFVKNAIRSSFAKKVSSSISVAEAMELMLNGEILKLRSEIQTGRLYKPICSDTFIKKLEVGLAEHFHSCFGAMLSIKIDSFYIFGEEFCS